LSFTNLDHHEIENVIGTSQNDVISGNLYSNVFSGGAGGDTLSGKGGNDILLQDSGTGTLDWGNGGGQKDPLVVTTHVDENEGIGNVGFGAHDLSLREALAVAASVTGDDTITFDAGHFSTPRTITLGPGQLTVGSNVHIVGPGKDLLTIRAGDQIRGFHVLAGVTATIEGMTIRDGLISGGGSGGIFNLGALTVKRV
jgi:hypothetical protein